MRRETQKEAEERGRNDILAKWTHRGGMGGMAINRSIFHRHGTRWIVCVCFIPPPSCFSVISRARARALSCLLPSPRLRLFHAPFRSLVSTVISITTLYAALIIVGVMSSRKSSKTQQPRRVSVSYLSLSLPSSLSPHVSIHSLALFPFAAAPRSVKDLLSPRRSRDGYFANLRITARASAFFLLLFPPPPPPPSPRS